MPMRQLDEVSYAEERYLVAQILVGLSRIMNGYLSAHVRRGLADGLPVVMCAIYIGQYEDRPMSVQKLAQFLNLPRATVDRRVKAIVAHGIAHVVNRRICLKPEWLNADETVGAVRQMVNVLASVSRKITKMDNFGVQNGQLPRRHSGKT